jgi:hypothetical protein
MAIDYSFHVDDDLLRVKASGRDESLEEVMAYGMAIIEAAKESGCTRVLCDELELDYALGTFDTFEAAKFIADQVPGVAKVAIVCKPEYADDADFWETVATNRGMLVRMFHDLEEAEAWIR